MGLFNFGKRKWLLEWQNTLLEEDVPILVLKEKDLEKQTNQRLQVDLQVVQSSIGLLEHTTKPDVFFTRLQLVEERASGMVRLEKYVSFSETKPSAALDEFQKNKQECIYKFLIRYFGETFDKAEKLKTEKGKRNQYQKFYDSLQEYYGIMNESNIHYIERKYNEHK